MHPQSQHLEYKSEHTDTLERVVVGFLNSREGGRILIGVDDAGTILGLADPDGDQLKIKDRLKQNIQPSCLGLFDVLTEESEGKTWIKLLVASGSEKPYYLRKQGMSPRGCFLRIGSAIEPMPERQIEALFAKRTRNSISRIVSPRQDLKFSQLKIYYEATGREPNAQFLRNLELFTEDDRLNYAAYLLADINNTSIKVAKYAGKDRVELIENEEYGNCCLVKATKQVLDKLDLENRTLTRITSKERQETRLFDPVALREAVINAIIHNDYSYEGVPKFELFSDRLEITSTGSIPQGMRESEFFEGYSILRNKELMRIFRDLEMVEYLGSGMPRILRTYPKECFRLTENFTRMIFPFAASEAAPQVTPQVRTLLEAIITEHTREELQAALDLTDREHFRKSYLIPALEAGLIERTIPENPTADCRNTDSRQKDNPSFSIENPKIYHLLHLISPLSYFRFLITMS
jgi:predicted HTH transcriptional regulator